MGQESTIAKKELTMIKATINVNDQAVEKAFVLKTMQIK